MKFTEGAFKDWGYRLATSSFRGKVVTERESWILGNKEANSDLSSVENARMIDPGYDMMTPDQQRKIVAEVDNVLRLWPTHGQGKWKSMLMIKDSIADITLQQVLTRPKDFSVIACMNLNGDYLSDALAAQIGGIGIAPPRTSTTSPATPSSRPPTAPLSTPTSTRSTPARSSSRAR